MKLGRRPLLVAASLIALFAFALPTRFFPIAALPIPASYGTAYADDSANPDDTQTQAEDVQQTDGDAQAVDVPSGRIVGAFGPTSRGGVRPAPSKGAQIAEVARQYEGAPYRWAGASPAGFDCSGFTMYVYGKAGITIPRDHRGQLDTGKQVGTDELQPGDIVFFANTYARGLSHSGIYLGDNRFIHAETEWTGVVISTLWGSNWGRDFVGGSRPYEN